MGNWYYKNNTRGKYTFPLTTDELKSYVLQFIKETEVCLTEQSAPKIAQYAPKKKDGTLAKKRVTLLIKSKWANHDGDCTALIARNVSDTDLDIEMIDLYIGEDKFSSAEAIIAAGILDKTSRAQIVSSISAQIGDSAEKKQTNECGLNTIAMLLSLQQRNNSDDRTISELFLLMVDELADITFGHALQLILDMMLQMIQERFGLADDQLDEIVSEFIARLPFSYQHALHLKAA